MTNWTNPKPYCVASQRLHTYGPVQPMIDYDARKDCGLTLLVLVTAPVALALLAIVLGWIK